MNRFLARALFGALVAATVAAFFVAQRVKRAQPVVEKVRFTKYVSPNRDGIRDAGHLSFRLKKTDSVDVSIVNRGGDVVRTLATDRRLCGPCTHRFEWGGRTDKGSRAPDGAYFLRVTLRQQGRTVTSPRKLHLDTTPPSPVVTSVSPAAISPDGDGRAESARVRFAGPDGAGRGGRAPRFIVYRTGLASAVRVDSFPGRRGSYTGRWDGRLEDGRPAPPGNYLIAVLTRDRAGNLGSGPRVLPPGRLETAGHPGVRVRYVSARAPQTPVLAARFGRGTGYVKRGRVRFHVSTDRGRYRWAMQRVGTRIGSLFGRSRSRLLSLTAPTSPGVYLLKLKAGSHRYATPFVVRPRRQRPVLVVLPAIAWQARNPFDSDQDGWGETLSTESAVGLRRPFLGGGLPPTFSTVVEPLVRLLEEEGLRYDVTTDLGLIRDRGPALAGHSGVMFAGPEPYVPPKLARQLREYVAFGGRVAVLGVGAFRRVVSVSAGRLYGAGPLRPSNVFGERVEARQVPLGAVTVLSDRIGFFAGTGGTFGRFHRLETSERLPERSALLAGAGREVERPAIATYRLGRGIVARIGVDGFASQAAAGTDVRPIMLRLWKLLER